MFANNTDSAIAAMASEKRREAHAYGDIGLLESCDVLRVQDVAYASNYISFLLVNLEHLFCWACIDVAEHLYLKRYFVNFLEVGPDVFDASRQDFISIAIYATQIIVLQTDPSVETFWVDS